MNSHVSLRKQRRLKYLYRGDLNFNFEQNKKNIFSIILVILYMQ